MLPRRYKKQQYTKFEIRSNINITFFFKTYVTIVETRAICIRGATTTPSCPLFTEPPAFLSAPALCLLLVGRRRGGAALCCCATNIQLGPASSINIRSSLNKAQSYPNCCAVSFRAASLLSIKFYHVSSVYIFFKCSKKLMLNISKE